MSIPRTSGIIKLFEDLPKEIKLYFSDFNKLAQEFDWDVSIAYLFSLVELAHNMTIYCGVVKIHKVQTELAANAVDGHHLTRENFRVLFETVLGKPIKPNLIAKLQRAEKIRDRILHGKSVKEEEKRKAITEILEYAEGYNSFVCTITGFKPFGSLKGFKGRGKSLDKSTSGWILKGMGLL